MSTWERPLADWTVDELDRELAAAGETMRTIARSPIDIRVGRTSEYCAAGRQWDALRAELRRPGRIRERSRIRAQDDRDMYDADLDEGDGDK